MIEFGRSGYTGGADQAIADGVIIALNDYMKDYAPNYYNYMEGEKAKENNYKFRNAVMTMKGNYYGLGYLSVSTEAMLVYMCEKICLINGSLIFLPL